MKSIMEDEVPHKETKLTKRRVAMIEDNQKIRESVIKYLSFHSDIDVVLSFGSAESYFEHINEEPEFNIDVLLLDIGLPGMTGLDAIKQILEHQPNLDIIMLTTYEEEHKIMQAMCSGAVAYISKRESLESILEAIRIVNNGGSYMSPMIAREFFNLVSKDKLSFTGDDKQVISIRQKEILELLVKRKTYNEIASELFISIETVRSHIKRMYKVLKVNSKSEAIHKYLTGKIK